MTNCIFAGMIHDLTNPKTGRTYKEDNMLLEFNIPIGALVEILPIDDADDDQDDNAGVRLHVIHQARDCDGTPLYWLGVKGSSRVNDDGFGYRTFGGYREDDEQVIRLPAVENEG